MADASTAMTSGLIKTITHREAWLRKAGKDHTHDKVLTSLRKALADWRNTSTPAAPDPTTTTATDGRKRPIPKPGHANTTTDPTNGLTWYSARRSAVKPDGTPIPTDQQACVSVTVLRR